jgi:hypothetical protein
MTRRVRAIAVPTPRPRGKPAETRYQRRINPIRGILGRCFTGVTLCVIAGLAHARGRTRHPVSQAAPPPRGRAYHQMELGDLAKVPAAPALQPLDVSSPGNAGGSRLLREDRAAEPRAARVRSRLDPRRVRCRRSGRSPSSRKTLPSGYRAPSCPCAQCAGAFPGARGCAFRGPIVSGEPKASRAARTLADGM